MKKYLNLTAIAALLAALTLNTACNKEDATEDIGQPIHEPLILGIGIEKAVVTRAYTDLPDSTLKNTWQNGILVKVNTTEADGTTNATKAYVTYNTGTVDETAVGVGDVNTNGDAAETTVSKTTIGAESGGVSDASKWFFWNNTTEKKTIKAWTFGRLAANSEASGTAAALNNAVDFKADGGTYTLPTDQTAVATGQIADFLYAHQDITYGQNSTSIDSTHYIRFKHQLALVDLIITTKKGATYVRACTFGDGNTSLLGVPVSATFAIPAKNPNPYTGTETDADKEANNYGTFTTPTYGTVTPRDLGSSDDAVTKKKYSAVLIPGDYYNDTKMFKITYDGTSYVYKGKPTDILKAGYHYTYNIEITDVGLTVTATIKPWVDTVGRNGSAVLE